MLLRLVTSFCDLNGALIDPQLCQDRYEAYDCVLDALACLGTALPELVTKRPPSSYNVLPMLYMDIMNFYSNLLHVLQTRGECFMSAKLAELMLLRLAYLL